MIAGPFLKNGNIERALASAVEGAVVTQVVPVVISGLLLGVGENGEGLAHFLEFLLLFLLHLRGGCTVAVCRTQREGGLMKTWDEGASPASIDDRRRTRVVQQGTFAVGFFDLVVGGVLADTQHLVVIFPLALFQLQLGRLQQMLVVWMRTGSRM